MVNTPDGSDGYKMYAALDRADRRQIARAVNRGQAVNDRKLANVAVAFARRQQKFWRYAWLIGPALGVLQFFTLEPAAAAFNALIGSGMLIGAALWFHRKAKRSEQLCRELYATKKGNPAGPKNRQVPLPDVRAPYTPRGKKRRR